VVKVTLRGAEATECQVLAWVEVPPAAGEPLPAGAAPALDDFGAEGEEGGAAFMLEPAFPLLPGRDAC
jgi:hypothetical protein